MLIGAEATPNGSNQYPWQRHRNRREQRTGLHSVPRIAHGRLSGGASTMSYGPPGNPPGGDSMGGGFDGFDFNSLLADSSVRSPLSPYLTTASPCGPGRLFISPIQFLLPIHFPLLHTDNPPS